MSMPRNELPIGGLAVIVILVGVLLTGVLFLSYEQVSEGHAGVEKEFGAITGTQFDAGAHLNAPWKSVQSVECRPRTYTMSDAEGEGQKDGRQDTVVVQSVNGTRTEPISRSDITSTATIVFRSFPSGRMKSKWSSD